MPELAIKCPHCGHGPPEPWTGPSPNPAGAPQGGAGGGIDLTEHGDDEDERTAGALERAGRHAEAAAKLEGALRAKRALYPERHPEITGLMCAVARCRFRAGAGLCAQGQHAEALASFEEAAALRARVLGEGHQETRGTLAAVARCRIALGTGLTRRGQHKEALASFEDALRVREQALGEGSGDIADAHHAVGLARYQLGVSGEGGQAAEGAEDEGRGSDRRTRYFERSLESFARVLLIRSCAEEGERVADTHYCVGLVRLGLKRGAEALNSLKEALRIRRQVCQAIGEEEGEGVAAALSGIGSAYSLLGQPQSALTSCTEALRIRRRVHRGAEGMHARVADAHYNVGLAQAKQRRYPAALGSYEEALRIRHHVLGAAHPDTLRAAEQVRLLHVAHSPARA